MDDTDFKFIVFLGGTGIFLKSFLSTSLVSNNVLNKKVTVIVGVRRITLQRISSRQYKVLTVTDGNTSIDRILSVIGIKF